ncbi:MAG: hypothetical protein ABIR06_03220 [Cyclobacteriaceae bacterium]
MMSLRWKILFLFISQVAIAQKSPASLEFFNTVSDCATSLGGWKCLELDLSSESSIENDSTNGYLYSWSLGDGSRKPGDKVEHCYEAFGSYQISMDLIDAETNTVIRNELSATVDLYPEIQLSIQKRSEDLPPSFLEFSCHYNHPELFEPDHVYWRIDGKYYEGKKVVHAFHTAGVYVVEMGIEKNTELTGLITACATTEITMSDSDIWTTPIIKFFEASKKSSSAGPFVKSDVFCQVISQSENKRSATYPINFLMSQVEIKENEEYEILLFSGNSFTQRKKFNAAGLAGNELYGALKDTLSSFLLQPLNFFKAVAFHDGEATPSMQDNGLNETAELLLLNPSFKIEIGSYIHTGSRIEKGMQASLQKATTVKESLIKNGIREERISIASPDNNKSLINTCSAISDCNWENSALNNKVEFKITGSNYEH